MRICGICRLAFRANDPGGTCTVPGGVPGVQAGHYSACSECCAKYDPSPHFQFTVASLCTPYRYDTNEIPSTYFRPLPDGELQAAPPWFCAICRRCARENDTMHLVRLYPEDAPDEPWLFNRQWNVTIGDYGPVLVEDLTAEKALKWFRTRCQVSEGELPEKVEPASEELRPAGYYACGECRRKYAPKILERLIREGRVPEGTPLVAMLNPYMVA